MKLLGITIRSTCGRSNCRLYFMPTDICFGCQYFIPFDIDKIIEDLLPIKYKAEEAGRSVYEVVVKNNQIIKILYDGLYDGNTKNVLRKD